MRNCSESALPKYEASAFKKSLSAVMCFLLGLSSLYSLCLNALSQFGFEFTVREIMSPFLMIYQQSEK